MSVNWDEIINAGIKKLDWEDSCEVVNEWTSLLNEDSGTSADYYFALGMFSYRQKRYMEAIKQYTKAIDCDSRYYQAYFYRGTCHCESERYQQGIKDYAKTIEIKPDFADAYRYRGFIRQGLGDLAGAIADFTEVVQLEPNRVDTYYHRGATYSYLGDYKSAVADFSKTIDFGATAARHYNRGVIYYLTKEYALAIADLNRAIELEPRFISAYFNLGNAYYQIYELEQAHNSYQQAVRLKLELDPQDEHAYYARGICALNHQRSAEGIEYLRQATFICREVNNLALNLKIASIMKNLA
ncbi:tetratricopeptide repeat protein [Pleurocapsales cyanobacterium LEGE 10410]|nr:tetratricopeptide repeat protein [Pleurocapsales cyanobacterium LEGE 10410]